MNNKKYKRLTKKYLPRKLSMHFTANYLLCVLYHIFALIFDNFAIFPNLTVAAWRQKRYNVRIPRGIRGRHQSQGEDTSH